MGRVTWCTKNTVSSEARRRGGDREARGRRRALPPPPRPRNMRPGARTAPAMGSPLAARLRTHLATATAHRPGIRASEPRRKTPSDITF